MSNLGERISNHLLQSTPMERFLQEEVTNLRIERARLEHRLQELPRLKSLEQAVINAAQTDPVIARFLKRIDADGHTA